MVILHVGTSKSVFAFSTEILSSTPISEVVTTAHSVNRDVANVVCLAKLGIDIASGRSSETHLISPPKVCAPTQPDNLECTNELAERQVITKGGLNLMSVCEQALEQISSKQCVIRKDLINLRELILACIKSSYPEWESIRDDKSQECKDIAEPVLWWVSHKLHINDPRKLSELVGTNEKTCIKVRLMSSRDGPPVRENLVDTSTHSNILSFYYKRQQELKKLEEDDDDSYLSSEWTDPRGLKHALLGCSDGVKWKY